MQHEDKNVILIKSMGRKDYWGFMNLVKANYRVICIGNSSSGIKETAAFHCPTLNIGDRQKGRMAPGNVLNCPADSNKIFKIVTKMIENRNFFEKCKKIKNPYGIGNAGKKIATHITNLKLNENILIKKITI